MMNPGIDWTVVPFRTSSFSSTNGGNCVEVGWADITFRKSSFSDTTGGNCVEVGARSGVVGVRDSKSPGSGLLELAAARWALFADEVKAGRL